MAVWRLCREAFHRVMAPSPSFTVVSAMPTGGTENGADPNEEHISSASDRHSSSERIRSCGRPRTGLHRQWANASKAEAQFLASYSAPAHRSQSTATPIASAFPPPVIDPTERTSRVVIPHSLDTPGCAWTVPLVAAQDDNAIGVGSLCVVANPPAVCSLGEFLLADQHELAVERKSLDCFPYQALKQNLPTTHLADFKGNVTTRAHDARQFC
jgi:hypothetical protein